MRRSPPSASHAPDSASLIGLLRAIAALEVVSALFVAILAIFGLRILPRMHPVAAGVLLLVGAGFAASAVFAGIQLWRLREAGRIATIGLLIVLMLFSAVLFLSRGQPHVLIRLGIEAAMLVVLVSRGARDACAS